MSGVSGLYLVLLAGVAGYVLIARVPSILHTPMMSVRKSALAMTMPQHQLMIKVPLPYNRSTQVMTQLRAKIHIQALTQ